MRRTIPRHRVKVGLAAVAAVLVAACGSSDETSATDGGVTTTALPTAGSEPAGSSSTSLPSGLEPLLAAARAESGAVSIFVGSGGFTSEQLDRLGQGLTDFYGLPIEIAGGPAQAHPQFIQQLVSESGQGIPPSVDVVATVNTLLPAMTDAGLISEIDWIELGVDDAIVEPQTFGVRMHDQLRGIIYNPDLVDPDDVPTRYEDLLEPEWRGRICAPAFASLFAALTEVMGVDETRAYAQALVDDQDLTFVQTITDAPARVANGEFAVCVGADSGQEGRSGAPVADAPLDAVLGSGFWAVVLRDSPRPALATLVTYFLASDEGQRVLDETLAWGRFDVEGTKANEAVADGVEPVFPSLEWNLNELPALDAEFRSILGLP